jgi:uncharacterized protein (DUF169 family)
LRARALTQELHLERAPVALAFVDGPPAGVPSLGEGVPSACTFWRLAERSVFYAGAAEHHECAVGAMRMGFELPGERQGEAQQLVGTMVELGYISMEEVPYLPSVSKPHVGILYGPLEQFPVEPDIVPPRHVTILAEAGDTVTLRAAPALPTMGRPACAAVARTANQGDATLSLGCIGARTYVEVPDDHAIMVLAGRSLDRLVERLTPLNRANDALAEFHANRKRQFAEAGAGD